MQLKGINQDILKKILNDIGTNYTTSISYNPGAYVIKDGQLYKAKVNTSTTWVASEWDAINIMSQFTDSGTLIAEEPWDSTKQYHAGDIVQHDNKVYKCLVANATIGKIETGSAGTVHNYNLTAWDDGGGGLMAFPTDDGGKWMDTTDDSFYIEATWTVKGGTDTLSYTGNISTTSPAQITGTTDNYYLVCAHHMSIKSADDFLLYCVNTDYADVLRRNIDTCTLKMYYGYKAAEWKQIYISNSPNLTCIAPEYDEEVQYYLNDIIIHDGKCYYLKSKSMPGPWNPDEWTECPLSKLLIYDAIAPIWNVFTSYGEGKWTVYRGHLYICIVEQATIGQFKDDEWTKVSIDENLNLMVKSIISWIAPVFNEIDHYEKHALVIHLDNNYDPNACKLYRALDNIAPGPWDESKWEQTNLAEVKYDFADANSVAEEWANDAIYAIGDIVMYKGKLCKAVLTPTPGTFLNDEWDLTCVMNEVSSGGEKGIAPDYDATTSYQNGVLYEKNKQVMYSAGGGVAPADDHNSTMFEYFNAFAKAFQEAYNTPLVWGWDITNLIPTCTIATPTNSSFYGSVYQTYMDMGSKIIGEIYDNNSNGYISVYESYYHDSVIYGTVFFVPAGKKLCITNGNTSAYWHEIIAFKNATNITPSKDYIFNPGFKPTRHGDTMFYGDNLIETMNTNTKYSSQSSSITNYYEANEDSWAMIALRFKNPPSTDDPAYKKKILDAFTFTIEEGKESLGSNLEVSYDSTTKQEQITNNNKRAIMNCLYTFDCSVGEIIVRNTSPVGSNRLQVRISCGGFDTEFCKTENEVNKYFISSWLKHESYTFTWNTAPTVVQDWTDIDEIDVLLPASSRVFGNYYYVEVRKDTGVSDIGFEDFEYITVSAQSYEVENPYRHGIVGTTAGIEFNTYFRTEGNNAISLNPTLKLYNSTKGIFKITNSEPSTYQTRIFLINNFSTVVNRWIEYKKDGEIVGYNIYDYQGDAKSITYSDFITGDIQFYNFDASVINPGTGYYYGVEISKIDGTKITTPEFLHNTVKVEIVPYLSCSIRDSNKYFSCRSNKSASLRDNMLIKLDDLPTGKELVVHDKSLYPTLGGIYATVISIPTTATLTENVIRNSDGNIVFKDQVARTGIDVQYFTTDQDSENWTSKQVAIGQDAVFTSAEIIPGRNNYLSISTYGLSSTEAYIGYRYLQNGIEYKLESPLATYLTNAKLDMEEDEGYYVYVKKNNDVSSYVSNDPFMTEYNDASGNPVKFIYTGTDPNVSITVYISGTSVYGLSDLIINKKGLQFKNEAQTTIDAGTNITAFLSPYNFYSGVINLTNKEYIESSLWQGNDYYFMFSFVSTTNAYTYEELKSMLTIEYVIPEVVSGRVNYNSGNLVYNKFDSNKNFCKNLFIKYTEDTVISANISDTHESSISNWARVYIMPNAVLNSTKFIDNGDNTYSLKQEYNSGTIVGTCSDYFDSLYISESQPLPATYKVKAGDVIFIEYYNNNNDPEIVDQIMAMYDVGTAVIPNKVHQNVYEDYNEYYTMPYVDDKKYISDNSHFLKYYEDETLLYAYSTNTYSSSASSEMFVAVISGIQEDEFNQNYVTKTSSGDYKLNADYNNNICFASYPASATYYEYSINGETTEADPEKITIPANSFVVVSYQNESGDDTQFDTIKAMYYFGNPPIPDKIHQRIKNQSNEYYTESFTYNKNYIADNSCFLKYYEDEVIVRAKVTDSYERSISSEMLITVISNISESEFKTSVVTRTDEGNYRLNIDYDEDKCFASPASASFNQYNVNNLYSRTITVPAGSYISINYHNFTGDDNQFETIKAMYEVTYSGMTEKVHQKARPDEYTGTSFYNVSYTDDKKYIASNTPFIKYYENETVLHAYTTGTHSSSVSTDMFVGVIKGTEESEFDTTYVKKTDSGDFRLKEDYTSDKNFATSYNWGGMDRYTIDSASSTEIEIPARSYVIVSYQNESGDDEQYDTITSMYYLG